MLQLVFNLMWAPLLDTQKSYWHFFLIGSHKRSPFSHHSNSLNWWRPSDLKSGDRGSKSFSAWALSLFLGRPKFNSSVMLVTWLANWSASRQLGFLTMLCSFCIRRFIIWFNWPWKTSLVEWSIEIIINLFNFVSHIRCLMYLTSIKRSPLLSGRGHRG